MINQAQSRSDAEPSFCKRELAVLRLLAKEQSSQQIGDTLSIEKRTAEVYVQLITAKLRAVNDTHAVAIAIRNKII
jgi:DNA-binding CsgD family transcriptional regulator